MKMKDMDMRDFEARQYIEERIREHERVGQAYGVIIGLSFVFLMFAIAYVVP